MIQQIFRAYFYLKCRGICSP